MPVAPPLGQRGAEPLREPLPATQSLGVREGLSLSLGWAGLILNLITQGLGSSEADHPAKQPACLGGRGSGCILSQATRGDTGRSSLCPVRSLSNRWHSSSCGE